MCWNSDGLENLFSLNCLMSTWYFGDSKKKQLQRCVGTQMVWKMFFPSAMAVQSCDVVFFRPFRLRAEEGNFGAQSPNIGAMDPAEGVNYVDEGVESSSPASTSPAGRDAEVAALDATKTAAATEAAGGTEAAAAPEPTPEAPPAKAPPVPAGTAPATAKAATPVAAAAKATIPAQPTLSCPPPPPRERRNNGRAAAATAGEGKATSKGGPAAKPRPAEPEGHGGKASAPAGARAETATRSVEREGSVRARRPRRTSSLEREFEEVEEERHPMHAYQECPWCWRTVWGGRAGMDMHQRSSANCRWWQAHHGRRGRPSSPARAPNRGPSPEPRMEHGPRAAAARGHSPEDDDGPMLERERMANVYRPRRGQSQLRDARGRSRSPTRDSADAEGGGRQGRSGHQQGREREEDEARTQKQVPESLPGSPRTWERQSPGPFLVSGQKGAHGWILPHHTA